MIWIWGQEMMRSHKRIERYHHGVIMKCRDDGVAGDGWGKKGAGCD